MLSSVWDFLRDGSNQTALGLIGSAIATIVAAVFAVIKLLIRSSTSISADRGGMAAGRDIINAPVAPKE
jgi:hypothetical protein